MNDATTLPLKPLEPALKTLAFPADNTAENVQGDLLNLWKVVVGLKKGDFVTLEGEIPLPGSEHPDAEYVDKQARNIFAAHPDGRKNADEGKIIQHELRLLLGFPVAPAAQVPTPEAETVTAGTTDPDAIPLFGAVQPQPTVTTPQPVTASVQAEDAQTEPNEEASDTAEVKPGEAEADGEDDESSDGEQDGEDETAAAEAATPEIEPAPTAPEEPEVQLSSAVTPWNEAHIGSGLISGLASTMNKSEVMQLIICRTGAETLMVCIETKKIDGEQGEPHPGLKVTGTPLELDNGLVGAMPVYAQARQVVRDSATEYLQSVIKTTTAAKKAADAKAAKPPKPATPAAPAKAATTTAKGKPAGTPATAAQPATRHQPTITGSVPPAQTPAPSVTSLTVDLTNKELQAKDVSVTVSRAGAPDEQLALSDLVGRPYPAGRMTLLISATGYKPNYNYPILAEGKLNTVAVTLDASQQPSLMAVPGTEAFQPNPATAN